jgi:hypothetical protein
MNAFIVKPLFVAFCTLTCVSIAAAQDLREWSDATGKFKITGSLIEVKDGNAFIKNQAGKTLKVPVSRLSQADQEFLQGSDNPFEMVEEGAAPASNAVPSGTAPSVPPSSSASSGWSTPKETNWSAAKELTSRNDVAWNVPPFDNKLPYECARASLSKKTNFHEHMHAMAVNPLIKRAVVGYSVTFSVPKPLSRLSLMDLDSGKSIHSEQIEANMRPLAVLNSGSDVLMVGAGDARDGYETKDQLQIWRFNGTKLARTASWVPYPNDKKDFGKQANANVVNAVPVRDNKLLTLSDKGHVALWDIATREPIWHARMSGNNFAMDVSADRKLVALVDDKTLMIVKIETAEILGSTKVTESNVGWPRIRWSPSGKQLLFTSMGEVKVIDAATGQAVQEMTFPNAPIAAYGLCYPEEDYALLNNKLLVHLPTKIQVCEYTGAGSIQCLGGVSFIAVQAGEGGIFVPATFPHPAAAEMLKSAQSDPSMFLIHPGVGVSIDVSAVSGAHQQAARTGLEKAAQASGYQISPSSDIKLVASISGPKQEAVSYIAAGSYIVNKYTSTVKLQWNGQDLWSRSGSNVPGVLMTKRGQTMQQALDEAGKKPNLSVFEQARFPEFIQKPSGTQKGPARSSALMTSNFTINGLVDAK